jgi:aminoglycoside phosphotransferase (APT) family kinase protein
MALSGNRDPEALRAALAGWLARKLDLDDGEVRVGDLDLPPQGFSNETAYFEASWPESGAARTESLVARIQPDGHQLFLDADVLLQWRMMEAVAASSAVPVPPLFFAEPDASVIGSPFFVMGKVDGRVPTDLPPYHAVGWMVDDLSPAERARLWCNGIDTLAGLHEIDRHERFSFLDTPALGEAGLDQHLGQIENWHRWAAAGRPQPVVDVAMRHLRAHQPVDTDVGVVWGDARLGNILFADDLSVAAVLDWEMAALGPGEVDLGWWLFMDRFYSEGLGVPRLAGLPDRAATVAHYESRRGRVVRDLEYYEVLAAVRMAVVIIRSTDKQVEYGVLDPATTMGTNNPATQLLAEMLGLPVPELSPELEQAKAAAAEGVRS